MRWLTVGIGMALLFVGIGNAQTIITMRDACDPDSFNAVVGPGTCVAGQHGNTLFSDFIGELQTDQIAGAWRFNPILNATESHFNLVRVDLKSGDKTTIQNKGGKLTPSRGSGNSVVGLSLSSTG